MSLKVLGVALVAFALYGGYHKASLYMNGYEAGQIEDDLCKGHRLVEQDGSGDSTLLVCSHTKIGNPIQVAYHQHQVPTKERFTLSQMIGLCKLDKEEPHDRGGKLVCLPKDRKTAKN